MLRSYFEYVRVYVVAYVFDKVFEAGRARGTDRISAFELAKEHTRVQCGHTEGLIQK